MILFRLIGTLLALPHTLIGISLMLIPWWNKVWFPYVPRKARLGSWAVHFIAGGIIPDGLGGGKFQTAAQTHGSLIWFAKDEWDLPGLVAHEERHVRQGWLFGPLFPLLYISFFLVNFVLYKGDIMKAYWENPFERDARLHEHKGLALIRPPSEEPPPEQPA